MLVSDSEGLLQIIEGLIQLADLDIVLIEAVRLLHIDVLLNIAIEKGGFDVHLFHVPIHNRRKRKNRFVAHGLYHRRESVMVVTALLLFESSNNPACLVASGFLRRASLHDVDPATSQDTSPLRRLDKAPSVVVHEGLVLISHAKLSVHTGLLEIACS